MSKFSDYSFSNVNIFWFIHLVQLNYRASFAGEGCEENSDCDKSMECISNRCFLKLEFSKLQVGFAKNNYKNQNTINLRNIQENS